MGLVHKSNDPVEAARLFSLAADMGSPRGQMYLGTAYATGNGVDMDKARAIDLWTKSIYQGNNAAMGCLAKAYAEDYDTQDKAVGLWKRMVDENSEDKATALFSLGVAYHEGKGVQVDHALAVDMWTQASRLDHCCANTCLGMAYLKGHGVREDQARAVHYFERATEGGCEDGIYHLGDCYSKGLGVQRNPQKAARLWRKGQSTDAQASLGLAYSKGDGVKQNHMRAFELWSSAAEDNDAESQFQLGLAFAEGRGVVANMTKSISYWEEAADNGHAGASMHLGIAYETGQGTEPDAATAAKYYDHACYTGSGVEDEANKRRGALLKAMCENRAFCKRVCLGCGDAESDDKKVCSLCHTARFCSKKCLTAGWGMHKAACKMWRTDESVIVV
jgi:TPR repeat protein